MERRREEDVEGWPTRPIDGGYDGLRQLAAADFSGAVRARGTTCFMLNGRIVGVFDGSIEDFEGASGTAHKAPHPSLPLLYAMQEQGGETRGKYYTNDTPISDVDQTLREGTFTGYVELSENVLSGDYYRVYHAGRAMSVAFVGTSERLVTGDEAFELADDEVGIYEVRDVDLDVRDVPREGDAGPADDAEPEDGDVGDDDVGDGDTGNERVGDGSTGTEGGVDAETDAEIDATEPAEPEDGADVDATAAAGASADAAADEPPRSGAGDDAAGQEPAGTATADGVDAATETASATDAGADDEPPAERTRDEPAAGTAGATSDGASETSSDPTDADAADQRRASSTAPDEARSSTSEAAQSTAAGADAAGTGSADRAGGSDAVVEAEPRADATPEDAVADETGRSEASDAPGRGATRSERERSDAAADAGTTDAAGESVAEPSLQDATVIPSLDPDRSAEPTPSPASASEPEPATDAGGDAAASETARSESTGGTDRSSGGVDAAFDEEVLEREDRIDRLQQRVSDLSEERDEVAAERDRLAERVDELEAENESLQAEVRQLEREVEELEAGAADAGTDATGTVEQDGPATLGPRAALEATDLFVRYDSKGQATLDEVADGASAEAVNDNLRLDLHTRFDADEATVDGEPFREFLEDTMAYRFVDWLVRELPYEIRDTGQVAAMRDCYDALPEVDRVEFHGVVELTYEEDGETVQAEEPFDVVVRDRMGETLFVADLNDSRDPADADMLLDLQSGATRVKEYTRALSGAFAVTRSFFDPDALETAAEATSGSLLSRDSRKSYVNVSRKSGYHLCLVEARDGNLHLNVPEL